jgi:hypothetical protein
MTQVADHAGFLSAWAEWEGWDIVACALPPRAAAERFITAYTEWAEIPLVAGHVTLYMEGPRAVALQQAA